MAFKTCHRSSKLVIVVVTTYLSIYLLICFHMMLFICLILWMEQVGAGAWKNEAWSYGAMEQVWGWCDGVWLRPDFMFLFMSHPSDSALLSFSLYKPRTLTGDMGSTSESTHHSNNVIKSDNWSIQVQWITNCKKKLWNGLILKIFILVPDRQSDLNSFGNWN